MSNVVVGKIIAVLPVESGVSKAGKEWKNQGFVIETSEEQYPKKICFTMLEKNDKFGGLSVGMDVEVSYNLESREYNSKWYTNNPNAWKVDVINKPVADTSAVQQRQKVEIPPEPDDSGNDLPF